MRGFKALPSAAATLTGIKVIHTVLKGQFAANGPGAFQPFAALAP